METWIQNLNNPLVLVGFVVFILAGVISLFIRKVNRDKQTQKITGNENTSIQAGGNVNMNADKPKKKSKK